MCTENIFLESELARYDTSGYAYLDLVGRSMPQYRKTIDRSIVPARLIRFITLCMHNDAYINADTFRLVIRNKTTQNAAA